MQHRSKALQHGSRHCVSPLQTPAVALFGHTTARSFKPSCVSMKQCYMHYHERIFEKCFHIVLWQAACQLQHALMGVIVYLDGSTPGAAIDMSCSQGAAPAPTPQPPARIAWARLPPRGDHRPQTRARQTCEGTHSCMRAPGHVLAASGPAAARIVPWRNTPATRRCGLAGQCPPAAPGPSSASAAGTSSTRGTRPVASRAVQRWWRRQRLLL